MCGIVGIIDPLNTIENKKELITTLNDTQNHRGPDDSGYYNDQYISLGFKRLSIIDIYKGNQPIKKNIQLLSLMEKYIIS